MARHEQPTEEEGQPVTHRELDIWRRVYATMWCDSQDAEEAARLANKAVCDLRVVNDKLDARLGKAPARLLLHVPSRRCGPGRRPDEASKVVALTDRGCPDELTSAVHMVEVCHPLVLQQ